MQLVTRHSSFVTARLGRALVTLAAALFAATTVRANQTSPNPTMQQLRDDLVEFAPEVPNNSYGEVKSYTYHSNSAGRSKKVMVLLPLKYNSKRKYPVLFILHGIFGDESSMLADGMGVRKMIAYAIAEGKTRDMIVVFPQMYTSPTSEQPGGFSFDQQTMRYYDMFEKDLLENLLPWVREEFSVAEGRANTAITGFSLGGREALYIGTRHTDVFGFVGAACPAPGILPTKDQFMEHEGTIKNEADFRLKDGNPEPHVLLISGGTNDGTVGNYPEQYHNILQRNEVDHVWHSISGARHDGSAVQPHLYNFVRHLFNVVDDVPYFDPAGGTNAVCSVCIPYTGQDTLDSGWYVVSGAKSCNTRIKVSGDVNLILADGCTLTAAAGITVAVEGSITNSLTIWAQSDATAEGNNAGSLTATAGSTSNAGIGGVVSNPNAGTVTVNGGTVTASCSAVGSGKNVTATGAGIGGGDGGEGGTVTVNGGTVNASGGSHAAGIGGGANHNWANGYGHSNTVVINGGVVNATGNGRGAGIGGGGAVDSTSTIDAGNAGSVVINGGQVTATSSAGYGIGPGARNGGNEGVSGTIELGWTNASDFISVSSYKGAVTLNDDFLLDGTDTAATADNSGGQKLVPNAAASRHTVTFKNG